MFNREGKNFRRNVLITVVSVMSLILVANLYILQVKNVDKYRILSDKNRIRVVMTAQKRGGIFTSDGLAVAVSEPRYNLVMEYCDATTFANNLDILSKYFNFSDDDKHELMLRRRSASVRHMPIVVKDNLGWDEYSKISLNFFKLQHVGVENSYIRSYPMPYELSHVTGYAVVDRQRSLGKMGLELYCDDIMNGSSGSIQLEVNSVGKKVRVIDSIAPISGDNVVISINASLQKYVYNLLNKEKAGSCVVIDIATGKILAFVSVPSFDVNLFTQKMSSDQWKKLRDDPLCPLLNRVSACSYPPGSIFKIAVAYAALDSGISPDEKIHCAGGVKLDQTVFHCWNRGGHGHVNLSDALAYSCDCYFFEIAKRLGIDKIHHYAKMFGFGEVSGIELPNEAAGLVPTKQWKMLRYRTSWKPYETMITAIGQGAMLATLLQSANMMGKIFSGSTQFRASLLNDYSCDVTGEKLNKSHVEYIKKALHRVCTVGTASRMCNTDYGMYGKTGSSQVRRLRDHEVGKKTSLWKYRDHAFFVGAAPYPNPKYIVAVFVEHGGGGASVAAPIVRQIFDYMLRNSSSAME